MLLGKEPAVDAVLSTLFSSPNVVEGADGLRHAVMIGAAVDVAIHKGYSGVMENHKAKIFTYYEKAILGTKSAVPVKMLVTFCVINVLTRLNTILFL